MDNNSPSARITCAPFRPAPWLKNRHLQTIWPAMPWVRGPKPALQHEWLELPDGDRTALEWLAVDRQHQRDERPLLIILHGLEGSADSPYCRHLMWAAAARGWRAVVLHFRDCGDYRNRLPRRYHAGETADLRFFIKRELALGQQAPIVAAGYSLGGNALLKYLGESRADTPLAAAVAVSVPLNLHISAEALQQGFSKLYQSHLLNRMKASVRRKFNPDTAAFDWQRTMTATSFAEFDDAITAPLHGFAGKDDYYDQCSAGHFLGQIEKPTLIIQSLDDPFMTPAVIPTDEKIANCVTLEVSEHGGHVGFIEGGTPWRPRYYLPERIAKYFDSVIS
jgi:predicted alpha/beta-fold hydrolase